ncbi:MAG: dockerin type I repeat-containing protein [Clostridia bacterium]|nr:dockerin type I repeat-containing protein [Clostridia bacterium]
MKKEAKPAVRFEEGSKQPMLLFFLGVIIVCAVIVIVSLATSGLSFTLGKKLAKGDINSDETLNSVDALNVLLRENGSVDFNGSQIDAADVDDNGRISSDDAVMIVQYSTGQSDRLGKMLTLSEPDEIQVIKPYDAAVSAVSQSNDEDTTQANSDEDVSKQESQVQQEPAQPDYNMSGSSDDTAYLTDDNNLYFTARVSNSWVGESGKNMYQIDFTVKNNSDTMIYTTYANVELSDDVLIEKTHNCQVVKKDDGSLKVTVSNAVMPFGSYRCSFIVSSLSEISVSSVDKQTNQIL